MAAASFGFISGEVTERRLSMPSGKPTSAAGNFMVWNTIRWPAAAARSIEGWNMRALLGVMRIVTVTPRAANSLAVSTSGVMWLGRMKYGRKRALSF